jgi:SAM-dependent methyltransferase
VKEILWTWNRYARPVPRPPGGLEAQRLYRERQDHNPERTVLDPSAEGPREHLSRYLLARNWARGRRVLDAGCGFAYGSLLMHRLGASRVVGLERDIAALRTGSAALRLATEPIGEGLLLVAGDLESAPLPDRSIDLIVALEVIEHLHEPKRFLSEAKRMLADSGLLLLSTPNRELISPGWEIPPNRFHVREYSPDELRELLAPEFPRVEMAGQRPGERLLRKRTQGRCGRRMVVSIERTFGFDPRGLVPRGVRSAVKRLLGDQTDGGCSFGTGGGGRAGVGSRGRQRAVEATGEDRKAAGGIQPGEVEMLIPRIQEWVSAGLEAGDRHLGDLYDYTSADSGEVLIALCHRGANSVPLLETTAPTE